MPYKSRAQAAYFNIHKGELEKQGVDVDEWNAASKGKKLPKHVEKKNKRGVISDKQRAKLASKWGKDDDGINASSR